jgi:hypothetical protein
MYPFRRVDYKGYLKTEIGFEYNHQGRSEAFDVWGGGGGGVLKDYTCNNYNKAFCDWLSLSY